MAETLLLTLAEFCEKAGTAHFERQLEDAYLKRFPDAEDNASERASWRNSLPALASLLKRLEVSPKGHILIEYLMPMGNRRADCILVGEDGSGPHIIIVELKQWSRDRVEQDDSYGVGWLKVHDGGKGYLAEHPCQQIREYHKLLSGALNFGKTVPRISSLVFLHNYEELDQDEILRDARYQEYLADTLLVTKRKNVEEAKALLGRLRSPSQLLSYLTEPELRYSDSFITAFRKGLNASALFKSTKGQNDAFQTIRKAVSDANGKPTCIVVEGIVGTGKTVLAMKLLSFLMQRRKNPQYYVRSAAIGRCLNHLDYSSRRITNTPYLIIDEAHRLDPSELPLCFIKRKVVVFFIDDHQWILPGETCRTATLEQEALRNDYHLVKVNLTEQLRCQEASAYLTWVDDLFHKRRAGRLAQSEGYRVAVVDSPAEMERALRAHAAEDKVATRIVSGFCWGWETKNRRDAQYDIKLGDWTARWNKFGTYREWNEAPGFHEEVGVVYTVQGFEYGYVGVLLGPDLKLKDGQLVIDSNGCVDPGFKKEYRTEEARPLLNQAIRNIYYILMTRAKHGVYLYSVNSEVQEWLKWLITRKR